MYKNQTIDYITNFTLCAVCSLYQIYAVKWGHNVYVHIFSILSNFDCCSQLFIVKHGCCWPRVVGIACGKITHKIKIITKNTRIFVHKHHNYRFHNRHTGNSHTESCLWLENHACQFLWSFDYTFRQIDAVSICMPPFHEYAGLLSTNIWKIYKFQRSITRSL